MADRAAVSRLDGRTCDHNDRQRNRREGRHEATSRAHDEHVHRASLRPATTRSAVDEVDYPTCQSDLDDAEGDEERQYQRQGRHDALHGLQQVRWRL